MVFTYDLSTNVGKVRLLITDTEIREHTFSDEELNTFLSMEDGNVYLAAAAAFGSIMRSRALLAQRIKREGYESQEHALADLRAIVKDLEQKAVSQGGIQTGEFALSGENFESYRPGWRDLNQDVTE